MKDVQADSKVPIGGPVAAGSAEPYSAVVAGQELQEWPRDLYIPPNALRVFLESFEGPLDLLLYLVRQRDLDIMSLNLVEITDQYLVYIELMEVLQIDLAAEYLVIAATLAEYKSRLLLPAPAAQPTEEVDPRAELLRRLQEYQRFREAGLALDRLPRLGRDFFPAAAEIPPQLVPQLQPAPAPEQLAQALIALLLRSEAEAAHQVLRESLSTRERMTQIMATLLGRGDDFVGFEQLCATVPGRNGVVVTLVALMELVKECLVEVLQTEWLGAIHIRHIGERR